MQTVGDYLKNCREAQNISLSDIAETTKISRVYLESLEKNEYEKIPAKPYVKGYIASYAACLGLDQHEALRLYDAYEVEANDSEAPVTENPKGYRNSVLRRRWFMKKAVPVFAIGVLFILSVGLYYSFLREPKQAVNTARLAEQPATKQPELISNVAYELSPQKQASAVVKADNQNGYSKPVEPRQGHKKAINGHSKLSDPPHSLLSKKYEKNAASDRLTRKSDTINKSSGSEIAAKADQKKAVFTNGLPASPKAKPAKLVSTVAFNSSPKKQNKISNQVSQSNGFKKTNYPEKAQKKPDNGRSQTLAPPPIQPPKSAAQESLPDQPIQKMANKSSLTVSNGVPLTSKEHLKIIEAAACSSVKNRTPQGSGDSFEWSEDKIFIWTRIKCERLPSSIRHIYYFKGEKVNDISLSVRSSHWRTWSYKTISNKRYIGPWRVDITSNDGKLLDSIEFEII